MDREKGIRTVPGTARAEEDLRSGTDGRGGCAVSGFPSFLPSFLPLRVLQSAAGGFLLFLGHRQQEGLSDE
jgi:hypothetical protein